jgi:hypothetical protein
MRDLNKDVLQSQSGDDALDLTRMVAYVVLHSDTNYMFPDDCDEVLQAIGGPAPVTRDHWDDRCFLRHGQKEEYTPDNRPQGEVTSEVGVQALGAPSSQIPSTQITLLPPAVFHDASQKDNEALTEAEGQHIFTQDLQNDTSHDPPHDPPHDPLPQAESFNSEGSRGTRRKRFLSSLSSFEVVSEVDMRPLKRLKSNSAGQTQYHEAFQGHEAVGSFEDLVHFSEILTILLSSPGPFVYDSQAWYSGSLAQSPTTSSNNVFANANNTIPLDPRLSCSIMPATSHLATTLI